jgi:SAM-dependent methyltransferase
MACELDAFVGAYEAEFPYALDNRLMLNWYARRVIESSSPGSMLELGVGHGYTTRLFSEHYERHVVVEGSEAVIRRFEDAHPDLPTEIVHGYFEEFTTSERFENIVMGFVLEHVLDPLAVLQGYRRFLEPRGRIFVAVPNATSLHRRIGHEAGLLPDLTRLSAADRELGHRRWFDLSSLRTLVTAAGLKVVRTEGLFLKPVATGQMTQLALSAEVLAAFMSAGVEYPELSAGILMELSS